MYPVLLALHSLICVLVVLIVLIQAGRSGGFQGLFGGGGDALFSTSSQQSGLRRATIVMAFLFMATSFFLTLLSSRQGTQSVLQKPFQNLPIPAPVVPQEPGSVPVVPSAQPAAPLPDNSKKP